MLTLFGSYLSISKVFDLLDCGKHFEMAKHFEEEHQMFQSLQPENEKGPHKTVVNKVHKIYNI
jgi:hypothetical protein